MSEVENNRIEELSDEQLDQVAGGLNPQPLPPGGADALVINDNGYRLPSFYLF
jgi:bacteriocin-like protein